MPITALIRRRVAMIAVPLALAGSLATATSATASHGGNAGAQVDLARAKAATARYNYEPFALADDYQRGNDGECVEVPGLGAMGIHYVNFDRFGAMDITRPDVLLYVNGPGGRRQLVAVEYLQVDDDQDLTTDLDRPSLFGRSFDGPMLGHGPEQPIHYDLHVWLWRSNPAGLFASFNPALSCS